jgi:hypothetical protein
MGTEAACSAATYAGTAGLGNTIVSGFLTGTTVSAGMQFVLSDGQAVDWGAAFKAGVGSAIGAGLDGYFGGQWSPSRVAAATVGGCVSASVAGGDCEQGATSSLIMAGLAWGGKAMREQMVDQSKQFEGIYQLDPNGKELETHTNVSGETSYWDKIKAGGVRLDMKEICKYATCIPQPDGRVLYLLDPSKIPSESDLLLLGDKYDPNVGVTLEVAIEKFNSGPLGANQGGPGKLFGFPYSPGSLADYAVEAYAGPHDWFNNFWGGYETVNDPANLRFIGNAAVQSDPGSLQALLKNSIINTVDLFLATPFTIGAELYNTNTHWLVIPVNASKDKE